jgi:hypothetical protein
MPNLTMKRDWRRITRVGQFNYHLNRLLPDP